MPEPMGEIIKFLDQNNQKQKQKMAAGCESSTQSLLNEVVNGILPKNISIKPKQLAALDFIVKGFDSICILPTGYGKSLIYQILPSVYRKLEKYSYMKNPVVVVVVSPLLSLIES